VKVKNREKKLLAYPTWCRKNRLWELLYEGRKNEQQRVGNGPHFDARTRPEPNIF